MPTTAHIRRGRAALVVLLFTLAACSLSEAAHAGSPAAHTAATAFFAARSYAPGEVATLHVSTSASLRLRLFRAGHGGHGPMQGAPVGGVLAVPAAGRVPVRIGAWPSGLYYARLSGGGEVAYAPFVVRPRRLGASRVLIVLPTNTWQAYNFLDEDGDGEGDTWYASSGVPCVSLGRAYVGGGVPPHYRGYDRGFVRWLALRGARPDFVAQDDLERFGDGDALARAYDLVVFPGHHEYVTTHEYDVVERFRDLGGNLAFLSANNFFYRVERRGERICRTGRWRDLGRPEARLVGIQYVDWNREVHGNKPYVVADAEGASWLFRGTGLRTRSSFGNYGIEIDARTPDSPRSIRVLCRIREAFGPGKSAEMTYYTTRSGAKVFAAGVLNFGGSAQWPGVSQMMANLWRQLVTP